nr:PR domain zinc finger protein 8 [Pogona vitticeps]
MMEDAGVHRVIWDGDAKAVQQCLTDIFTSVYTTCDIPENAIFGPCVLSHTSLYDSIAFIALKSTDKRTVPYIFRVDTSAANGSSEGLMWLRLVQSARDKEEQNLEAYIKNGQLFYRSLRRIAKDEELLVWYGKELTELLLLSTARAQSKMNGAPPYTCLECSQRFQFEFPYVAHLRFRCPKRLHGGEGGGSPGDDSSRKASSPAKEHEVPLGSGAAKYPSKLNGGQAQIHAHPHPPHHRPHYPHGAQDTNGTSNGALSKPSTDFHNELACTPQQQYRPAGSYFGLEESGRLFGPPSPETGEAKRSAFVEVKKASRGGLEAGDDEKERGSPGSAQGGGGGGELVRQVQRLLPHDLRLGVPHALPPQEGVRPGAPGQAPARGEAQLQLQLPSALTLLPPSFTSLCLPAQNWCAKCNASFRMTSDLVYHMRSHHKKEYALEPLVKRRREEKLKCPICNESFRERHHLSRHMTSHN